EPEAPAPQRAPAALAQPAQAHAAPPSTARAVADPDEPIAVIGMSGRFPKARDVDEMWSLLEQGVDAVEEVPPDRFDWRRYYSADPEAGPDRSNSKWCGCIPGLAEF